MANRLFEKTQIGNMRLKNRIVMGPMGTTGEADGAYTMDGVYYFEERAKGGCGLIITGANVVSTKYEPRPCTELSNFHHVERLNMLVDRCHHWGAKVCVQLSPGLGRQQFTDPFTPPYSAGACSSFWFPSLICKPFAKEDIAYLVERVGYSASLAVAAGADALELHAYGGYLLDQFQSTMWNACSTSSSPRCGTTARTSTAARSRTACASRSSASTRSRGTCRRASPSR